MISIDPFLDRRRRKGYDCLDFAREVWLALTGQDIRERLAGLARAVAEPRLTISGYRGFQKLLKPCSPCLAVMQRPRANPHIGIYLDGKILHLIERGVEFQPLVVATIGFSTVKYYK
jgi:hypothetical protein